MKKIRFCELTDRALINIDGPDATVFLQGLITCDVEKLSVGENTFGGLLSPQGKILFDFFIVKSIDGFMFDVDKSMAADFVRRLTLYKLRADVKISLAAEKTKIYSILGLTSKEFEEVELDGIYLADPRLASMGHRGYLNRLPKTAIQVDRAEYLELRCKHGVPSGGLDFTFGDAFPHEALMDQFNAVDFTKGCYVGQEVVSRIQHRSNARKRFISAHAEANIPNVGTEIIADRKTVGMITSKSGNTGIALVRLDHAATSVLDETPILAGSTPITLNLQEWVNFDWPK